MSIPIGPFRRVPMGGGAKLLPPDFPLFIPNLELYLDSRFGLGAFAEGASVTTWPDLSGHSPTRDAVSQVASTFTDPTMRRTTELTPLLQPSVQFGLTTAAPGNILASSSNFLFPTLSRGYTFYTYGKVLSKTAGPYPAVNQAYFGPTNKIASFSGQLLMDGGSGMRQVGGVDQAGGGNPHRFFDLADIVGDWGIHAIVWEPPVNNTTPMRYYFNGVEFAQTAGPTNFDLSGGVGTNFYTLGNLWNGNTVLRGNLSSFIWYSDAHSDALIALFSVWAGIQFGLT